ncbi:hypothetical protein FACS1894187_12770 [Synergistales bacterium]|nr:hypothetical protein FACS1894187_12770 [Synergistales bacterium]
MIRFSNGEVEIDLKKRFIRKRRRPIDLTPREFEILTALMEDPDKVFSRDELTGIVIGNEYDGSCRVIDSHISNLRIKLEDDPKRPVYVVTVYGVGYRFGGIAEMTDEEPLRSPDYVFSATSQKMGFSVAASGA